MELTIEEIQNLIKEKKVKAISLDTSAIQSQSFAFESGLLKQLEKFQNSHIKLIISEVIINEVHTHMEEPIEKAKKCLDNALKEAKKHWELEDGTIKEINKKIYQEHQPTDIVTKRIDNFIRLTSLEIVKAQEYLIINDLLEKYFQSIPPFSIGKKKNEFPDAIALISLESWAKKNKTQVIVVSKDNDWKDFCKNSEHLIFIDDLSKTLELFQKHLEGICKKLQRKYDKGEMGDLTDEINRTFGQELYTFDIYVEADSPYSYEEEIVDLDYKEFKFQAIQEPNIIFRPINYDGKTLVVQASLLATIDIECNFVFSTYDEGEFGVGANNLKRETNLGVDILITLFSKSGKFSDDIKIYEVEFITKQFTIDFGFIQPDMS